MAILYNNQETGSSPCPTTPIPPSSPLSFHMSRDSLSWETGGSSTGRSLLSSRRRADLVAWSDFLDSSMPSPSEPLNMPSSTSTRMRRPSMGHDFSSESSPSIGQWLRIGRTSNNEQEPVSWILCPQTSTSDATKHCGR